LDYAVDWAKTQTKEHDAASRITETIYGGSVRKLSYDMDGGYSNYGDYGGALPLRLANFLLWLKTGANVAKARRTWDPGVTPNPADIVNCSDCGCLTTAFANAIGANVQLTQINKNHRLNEIKAIGQAGFGFPKWGKGFEYHAFGSIGPKDAEKIYDACLEVGRPDPTIPATRTKGELPRGMPHVVATPASFGAVTFNHAPGSKSNGKLDIPAASIDVNNVMNDTFKVKCTGAGATGARFTATTDRSGTGTALVGPAAGNSVTLKVELNGKATATLVITQGTTAFVVGDEFEFNSKYNYDEYRGSLAAPDCVYGLPGRSAATTIKRYTFKVE
jgi:hypothetical protein